MRLYKKAGYYLCMTHLEEQFKEGIFENSEFKLLKQLIEQLENVSLTASQPPNEKPSPNNCLEDEKQNKKQALSNAATARYPNEDLNFNNNTSNIYNNLKRIPINASRILNDENDDEYIVEVDGDLDLEKVESQDENDDYDNDDHDDDDDVEYGQSKLNNKLIFQQQNDLDDTNYFNNLNKNPNDIEYDDNANVNICCNTLNNSNSANNIEVKMLEKFKEAYQGEYCLSDHKLQKHFEKIFFLIVNKRICSDTWYKSSEFSNKALYLTLYLLRIYLRNSYYQRQFLQAKNCFYNLAKLLKKYVNFYSTLHNQIIIHSHILDQLLNILTKILLSDSLLLTYDQQQRNGSGGGNSRVGSGGNSSNIKLATSMNSLGKEITKIFFEYNLHVGLMQMIEASNELCLIHASLNILIQISTLDIENRGKLAADLDISDQLLLILQEYDEDSKRFAAKLLCLLCIEEKIKNEVTNLDGIQVLLSLLHSHNNSDILWNVIWCLVQLSAYDDNKREIRLMGGIPLILSILCDKNLDSQLESLSANEQSTNKQINNFTNDADLIQNEKRSKARLQIQAACCALVGELAFNETNSYQIVNSNGVYLVASKLLLSQIYSNNSNSENKVSSNELERNKEIERLHCNVWRTLRLLFSAERHRSLIKKLIPFNMFEQFVDIGNFKKDLKLYQSLVESFYKLNKEEIESLRQQIKISNQTQSPAFQVNDYEVYEIIGSGAFGRVHKVKKKNSSVFLAMKEINTHNLNSVKSNNSSLGDIVNEVTIIRNNLKHPNIVRYLKTFKENDNLYIVMELIDGTPLSQHVRTLREKQEYWQEEKIWNLFIQIVLALKYLHKEKHIVHRDLTSNNIMLSENDRITITDFGLAKLKENDCSKMLSVVGTMFYSCPEIIKNEPYNDKADIWAIGCVLYEMCCLEPPFCTSNMLALATKITQSDYDHERLERNSYSSLISQVVQTCLIVEPLKRPDIIGVASLVAEKILNYTDSIRYKCVNLEKKLEKEKNKTQKLFCNKQDLNYQQRNQLNVKSTTIAQPSAATTAVDDIGNTSNSNSANSSLLNVQKETKPQRVERSISLSISSSTPKQKEDNESNSKNENAQENLKSNAKTHISSSPSTPSSSILSSQSPGAKLPPIRHPKSKLIMKNIQNKQQKQQETQKTAGLIKPSVSNTSLNQEIMLNVATNANDPAANQNTNEKSATTAIEADSKIQQQQDKATNSKIQRSSSSSILEKRSNQSKKSRPNSANSSMAPVYKKLRPIEDPILQILDQIHKVLFIAQLPPSGKKNFKRKLIDRYKRSLFSNKKSSMQIKTELMKLIKNSNDLIDMEMIGLKNFQYCFNSSDSTSTNSNLPVSSSGTIINQASSGSRNVSSTDQSKTDNGDLDVIFNQNGITYEQLQAIIEELLVENNYNVENLKHLREELPSIE